MQCPNCKIHFHPQTKYQYLGQNKKGMASAIYWQICPSCDEFIICIKKSSNGNQVLGDLQNLDSSVILYPNAVK
jgi:hypothetical protein